MKINKNYLISILISVTVMFTFAGCSKQSDSQGNSLQESKNCVDTNLEEGKSVLSFVEQGINNDLGARFTFDAQAFINRFNSLVDDDIISKLPALSSWNYMTGETCGFYLHCFNNRCVMYIYVDDDGKVESIMYTDPTGKTQITYVALIMGVCTGLSVEEIINLHSIAFDLFSMGLKPCYMNCVCSAVDTESILIAALSDDRIAMMQCYVIEKSELHNYMPSMAYDSSTFDDESTNTQRDSSYADERYYDSFIDNQNSSDDSNKIPNNAENITEPLNGIMPDLIGKYFESSKVIYDDSFTLIAVEEYNDNYSTGQIFEQDIKPREAFKIGDTVVCVKVSKGPGSFPLPNYANVTVVQYEEALKYYNVKYLLVEDTSGNGDANSVTRVERDNKEVKPGDKVSVDGERLIVYFVVNSPVSLS